MALPSTVEHYGGANYQVGDGTSAEGGLAELDTVSLDWLVACASFSGWRAAAAAAGFSRDAAFPGWSGMYVRDMSARTEGPSHALVTVNGHGLLTAGEKRKRIMSAAGQIIAVGPIEKVVLVWSDEETAQDPETEDTVKGKRRVPKVDADGDVVYKTISTPSGTGPRWNINQAFVTVSDTYFTGSPPNMTEVSTADTPPSAPSVPSYIWGGYAEPMRQSHPNGWVLDDRQSEEIVPGVLWQVTDSWGYYYAAQPD